MNNKGFSLIGAVISISIMTVTMAAMSKITVLHMKSSKSIELRNDRESIERMLYNKIDCEETLNGTCTPGEIMDIYYGSGKILVSKSTTNLGKHTVRAECNFDGDGIVFRAITMNKNGAVLADPLTGRKVGWNDDLSLIFPKGVSTCSASDGKKEDDYE